MAEPVNRSRRYDASRRQAAADRTRRAILDAGRELFLERGFKASTMPAIAERAGVAVDTVYAAVGPKPALFRELIETAISGGDRAVPAQQRDYVLAMRSDPDPERKLEIYAAALTAIHGRLAPLLEVAREAAATDPGLRDLWREISERRAANMRLFAGELERTGRLALPVAEAADIIWVTNSAEVYLLFVRERGWSPDRYRDWLSGTWTRILLRPG